MITYLAWSLAFTEQLAQEGIRFASAPLEDDLTEGFQLPQADRVIEESTDDDDRPAIETTSQARAREDVVVSEADNDDEHIRSTSWCSSRCRVSHNALLQKHIQGHQARRSRRAPRVRRRAQMMQMQAVRPRWPTGHGLLGAHAKPAGTR